MPQPWEEQSITQHQVDDELANIAVLEHGNIHNNSEHICQECASHFKTKSSLDIHAKQTQHRPYICLCNGNFSRLDVLQRHIRTSQPGTSNGCPYCNKIFVRSDHLLQHLRGYHHILDNTVDGENEITKNTTRGKRMTMKYCPYAQCATAEEFKSKASLTKHIREDHDASPFPCKIAECDKVDGKGYFRKRALLDHQRECHQGS